MSTSTTHSPTTTTKLEEASLSDYINGVQANVIVAERRVLCYKKICAMKETNKIIAIKSVIFSLFLALRHVRECVYVGLCASLVQNLRITSLAK